MLHDPSPARLRTDPILAAVARINGNNEEVERLTEGIYKIGHFGGTQFMPGYNPYPELRDKEDDYFGCYGVCDNYQQILDQCPALTSDPDRQFVITVNEVRKDKQPSEGGWRWHKWGAYIGNQESSECEYLFDEPVIESVFVYHIYELIR